MHTNDTHSDGTRRLPRDLSAAKFLNTKCRSYHTSVKIWALIFAVLQLACSLGRAVNDESYSAYLRKTALTPKECTERSPRDLMKWIAEREKLGFGGTTGHEQAVVDKFYASYREVLQREVDARFPEARKLREPLHKLHCFVFDFMQSITGNRTYVTHARIAAYTEHVLEELYSGAGMHVRVEDVRPTAAGVVNFARLRAAVSTDLQRGNPDFDKYSTEFLTLLTEAESADPKIPILKLRIYIVNFVYKYVAVLDPTASEPSG